MAIECFEFRALSSGALQGFADFRLLLTNGMGIEFFGCSVFMKDGRRWVSLPSREYFDKETKEKKYSKCARFVEKSHMDAISESSLKALDEFCSKQPEPVQEEAKSMTSGLQENPVPPTEEEVPF